MEWNLETLQFLKQCLLDTLSPLHELRLLGENSLSEAADNPNYGLDVLQLVAQPTVDEQIRNLAAANFKNYVKARWKPLLGTRISYGMRKQIKLLLASVLHTNKGATSPKFVAEIREALVMISKLDYPKFMEATIPQLKSRLKKAVKANDFGLVNDILTTADSLFEKFRYQDKWDGYIMSYLNHCLDNFAAPLLTTVKSISVKISATAATSTPALCRLIKAQTLCCRIFYSLNFLVLHDVFVYNVDKWINEFKKYLTVRYPYVEDSGADGLALVDELRMAVLDNISLYMENHEKMFQKYISGFVEAVLSLLVDASSSLNRERLTLCAVKYLTHVSTSAHHSLFSGDETLQQITVKIVIPNVMLRDEDEKLFEMNYVEFIRRDEDEKLFEMNYVEFIRREMEVSNVATRRRIACDLLKGIAKNYKEKVTERVLEQIRRFLALFAENPVANWKYKDCAIYLVLTLASVSNDLIDVEGFFRSVIVPELQGEDVNAFPMLKARALNFLSVFTIQIPKHVVMDLLGDVVRFLDSNVNAVHSYSAIFIEKLLVVKGNEEHTRFTSVDIGPVLRVLLTNLFRALEKPESGENQYIMRCIMRVFQIVDISPEVASLCITRLTTVLNRVCENPKNPLFNHWLFEAIAALVKRACEKNPSLVDTLESRILPNVQMIQAKEVLEFFPYTFQLIAQLVDFKQPPFSPQHMYQFDILLKPDMCSTFAHLPALVCVLQSFIQKIPNELNKEGRLRRVLDIFRKLVSSPTTEEHGFHILNPLIENLEYDGLTELMNYIWPSVFTRLQKSKTSMLVKSLIIFLSFFLVKHGTQTLVDSINSVQAKLFPVILGQFWIPNLKTITVPTEVKVSAVAATKLLCESPLLLDPSAEKLWGKLLDGLVTLLSQPAKTKVEEKRVEDASKVLNFGGETGYRATFVHLFSAAKKQEDPLKEINDPKHFSVALLAKLSSLFPGRFPPIITKYLSPTNQAAFLQLCNSYNLFIE